MRHPEQAENRVSCVHPINRHTLAHNDEVPRHAFCRDGRESVQDVYPYQCGYFAEKDSQAAGINRRLTYHMSRHSFATLCLSMGVPIETVSKMLGHQSIDTTRIYAKITRTKLNEDMTNLAGRIKGRYRLTR